MAERSRTPRRSRRFGGDREIGEARLTALKRSWSNAWLGTRGRGYDQPSGRDIALGVS